jgi:hypothetical protein
MALRKFREFVRDRQRAVSIRLEEETDEQDITDAATVIIGSELSVSERQSLRDGLINYITKVSDRGGTVIATVVALE